MPLDEAPTTETETETDTATPMTAEPLREKRLPRALLACYFLNTVTLTLPSTAFSAWLNDDVKMTLEDQSRYYALAFLPWSLKPLFSLLAERVPIAGMRRKPWVVLASAGTAASMIASSALTQSIAAVYVLAIVRSAFEALSSTVLGLVLIDHVGATSLQEAQPAQASTTAARVSGSIFAYVVGFGMYGCAPSPEKQEKWDPLHVILFSAVVPALAAMSGAMLPEPKQAALTPPSPSTPLGTVMEDAPLLASASSSPSPTPSGTSASTPAPSSSHHHTPLQLPSTPDAGTATDTTDAPLAVRALLVKHAPTLAGLLLVQATIIWASLQSVITSKAAWSAVMGVMGSITVGLVLYLMIGPPAKQATEDQRQSVRFALFLFLINAVPSTSIVWWSFQYASLRTTALGTPACGMQVLAVVDQVVSLAACAAHGPLSRLISARRSDVVFVVFTVTHAAIALAVNLPPTLTPNFATTGVAGMSPMVVFLVASVLAGFVGRLALVSLQVVATERCYAVNPTSLLTPGIVYGILLSLLDFGESTGAWIAAPIIAAVGVNYITSSWSGLWILVVLEAVATSVLAFFMPGLVCCRASKSASALGMAHAAAGVDGAGGATLSTTTATSGNPFRAVLDRWRGGNHGTGEDSDDGFVAAPTSTPSTSARVARVSPASPSSADADERVELALTRV